MFKVIGLSKSKRYIAFWKDTPLYITIYLYTILFHHHDVSWSYRLQAMAICQVCAGDVQPDRLFSAPGHNQLYQNQQQGRWGHGQPHVEKKGRICQIDTQGILKLEQGDFFTGTLKF